MTATVPPPPPSPRRWLRALAWASGAVLALLLAAASALWLWLGSSGSLAQTLALAARWLPAGQALQVDDVHGSLRSGGRIGRLQWHNAELRVELQDAEFSWRLRPLLQRRLVLGPLRAAALTLTPLGPASTQPPTPLQALELPLQIELPTLAIERITWAPPEGQPLALTQLQARYHYDGQQHQLQLQQLHWAEGRYQASAQLQAQAPMQLQLQLQGQLHTQPPGTDQPLQVQAQAQLQGPLAGAEAQLALHAQLQPAADGPAAPLRARLQAQLAPWAAQPLLQAQLELAHIDLASLWPQAPQTALSGQLQAGPEGSAWALQARLRNALPGPWDQQRLPLDALQARVRYAAGQWHIAQAQLQLGGGSVTLQGDYNPEGQRLTGQAHIARLRPSAIDSRLAPAPMQGTVQAEQGPDGVQFTLQLHSEGGSTHPLQLDRLHAQGHWQAPLLQLQHLQLQALQVQLQGERLALNLQQPGFAGQLQAQLPGLSAQLQGQLAAQAGNGSLVLDWKDPQRSRDWLAQISTLPGLPPLAPALAGLQLKGGAQLQAQWRGGWSDLQRQLQRAGLPLGTAAASGGAPFTLQARLDAPRFGAQRSTSAPGAALDLQLQDLHATFSGALTDLDASVSGQLRSGAQQLQLQVRAQGRNPATGPWALQLPELQLQWHDKQRPGPWRLALAQPLALQLTPGAQGALQLQAQAGSAQLQGPLPGQALLQWQALQWQQRPGQAPQLRSSGQLTGLPLAWLNAIDQAQPPLLERLGLGGDVQLAADWDIHAAEQLQARLRLQRSSGELRLLALASGGATTVRSSGSGKAQTNKPLGAPAGLRQAEIELALQGQNLRSTLRWSSQRAGELQAQAQTTLAWPGNDWRQAHWPASAPLAAQISAQLPELGVWSVLAPPGWRVKGTLAAQVQVEGTRSDPRWHGSLSAEQFALRSVIDGVDLQDGQLQATLDGQQLRIDRLQLKGGHGSAARILGRSGNRTPAPQDGGLLTASGLVQWQLPGADAAPRIDMQLQAQAERLQLQVRADRQLSVSGQLQAGLQGRQFTLRGQLRTDRATIVLPDAGAPQLGSDVHVRQATPAGAAPATEDGGEAPPQPTLQAALPPDIDIGLDLGDDFALQGHGITTRLTGALRISANAASGGQPRVSGEVRTDAGRYRAWGQALDVESGLIRFAGPYDNPQLDILALRPNISVRAGVQVTGSAQAPRVRLYADPDLPDAEKLSWVVLGHSAASGGSEAGLLQQAALAVLGRQGAGTGGISSSLGLDEVGIKGPQQGQDASAAALTLGKRISKALYLTYEHSLSGSLGTLYLFYDLSRHLTLRGQTGLVNALDLVYTVRYD